MPSFDPALFSDFRKAKAGAGVLAAVMGLEIGQNAHGKPCLFRKGQSPQTWPTWLALYTHLHRLRADQIQSATP